MYFLNLGFLLEQIREKCRRLTSGLAQAGVKCFGWRAVQLFPPPSPSREDVVRQRATVRADRVAETVKT